MAWELQQADALTFLRGLGDREADSCIADPPYTEDTHGKDLGFDRADGGKTRDVIDFPPLTLEEADAYSAELVRVVKRWIVVFGDLPSIVAWRAALEKHGAEWIREGAWWKTDAQPQVTGDRPGQGIELIGLAHGPRPKKKRGKMEWNGGGRHFRYMGPTREPNVERVHPTQKPEWLMRALVLDFTRPGELVIDPFAGSGTTGVEAVKAGREFKGCERVAEDHARAIARLQRTREQWGLFDPPRSAPKMTQSDLFGGDSK